MKRMMAIILLSMLIPTICAATEDDFILAGVVWKIETDYLLVQPRGFEAKDILENELANNRLKFEGITLPYDPSIKMCLMKVLTKDVKFSSVWSNAPVTLKDLMVSDTVWISVPKDFADKKKIELENLTKPEIITGPEDVKQIWINTNHYQIPELILLAPKELLPFLISKGQSELTPCDFSISIPPMVAPIGLFQNVMGSLQNVIAVIQDDLAQISFQFRDYGFKDYTVKFIDMATNTELQGKIRSDQWNTVNTVATADWRPSNIGKNSIKVVIIPQERITHDPDMSNNEAILTVTVLEGVGEGFYAGIPAAGNKKIGIVILQSPDSGEDAKGMINLWTNPDPKSDISLFYIEEFFRKESAKYTSKEFAPQIEIIGPYSHQLPPDANLISDFENYAIENEVNLQKYDIVVYLQLLSSEAFQEFASIRRSGLAYRKLRRAYVLNSVSKLPDWPALELEATGHFWPLRIVIKTITHEIMHIFGAYDHYFSFIGMTDPPDIMSNMSYSINDFTAQEIGWADRNHNGVIDAEEPYLYQFHGPSDVLYPKWDVDMNGVVGTSDLGLVVSALGEKIPSLHNRPNPDVNRDGIVNILDLILVAKHFGENSTAAAPSKNGWRAKSEDLPALQQICRELEKMGQKDADTLQALELIRKLISSIEEAPATALLQNYPNPFNPETWIPYQLAKSAEVDIKIYSAEGVLVRRLELGRQSAGFYTSKNKAAYWDGKNEAGDKVSSGIYFYNIKAGKFTATKKLVISK